MKLKLIVAAMALIIAVPSAITISASDSSKDSKEKLEKKTLKIARNEAKDLKKQGYKPFVGALPLDHQLDRIYHMREEFNDDGMPKYFYGVGNAVGKTLSAAQQQAVIIARQDIAGKIEADVTTLIESHLANDQISSTEAESIQSTMIESKSLISQKLAGTINVVECFREQPNGNLEVMVQVVYPRVNALKMASDVLRKNLEGKMDNFSDKINLQ